MKIETGKTNPVHTKDLMHSINNASEKITNNNPLIPGVPFHPGPVYRPPPQPIRHDTSIQQGSQSSSSIEDINPNINLDFEGKFSISRRSYVQNLSKTRQIIFWEPKELGDLINKGNLIQKFFAKAGRFRQNFESNSKKSIERDTFAS